MRPLVIKYGGAAMNDAATASALMLRIAQLPSLGLSPVLVHGGGREIERMLSRLQIPTRKLHGLRVSDAESMEVIEMVLSGKINKQLAALIQSHGGKALGLSGRDGGLFKIEKKQIPGGDLGFVATVIGASREIIDVLLAGGFIPVVSSIGDDGTGIPYNINADEAAAALAIAIGAEKLLLMSDIPGILADYPDPASLIPLITSSEAEELLASGRIDKGMLPKLQACLSAIKAGVGAVQIIDGREPALLAEALKDGTRTGTTISA